MSFPLLLIVTLIYLGIAVSYWLEGNKGMGIVFAGYSLANIGFLYGGWK